MSFDELYFFDESDNYGSGSRSPDNSVGSDRGVGSGVFVLTIIESIADIVASVVFVLRVVDSKVGRFIRVCWLPKP